MAGAQQGEKRHPEASRRIVCVEAVGLQRLQNRFGSRVEAFAGECVQRLLHVRTARPVWQLTSGMLRAEFVERGDGLVKGAKLSARGPEHRLDGSRSLG